MTASHYTAVESQGVGLVVVGQPDYVARLIAKGRLIHLDNIALLARSGFVYVDPRFAWTFREVRRVA